MRVRTYVETMSKMANNRDNRLTDPENLTEFLLKRGCIVHKNPVNKYMNFINAFVFVNEHRKRADAVLEWGWGGTQTEERQTKQELRRETNWKKKTDQARTEHSENKATVTNGPANAIRMIFVPLWLYKLVLRTAFARTFVTVAIKCGGKNQHFLRTLLGGRGGGLEKCMVCTPVKMLIIVNDP